MNAPLPRILLVEPQFVLRRTIVMVARDLRMVHFEEVSSVGRARVLLGDEAYDGLVLDMQEGQQAMELLSDLRQGRFPTPRDARVVVLTAGSPPADADRMLGMGVARVLGKPVRISELLDAITGVQVRVS